MKPIPFKRYLRVFIYLRSDRIGLRKGCETDTALSEQWKRSVSGGNSNGPLLLFLS